MDLVYVFLDGYEDEIYSEEGILTKISEALADEAIISNIEKYLTHNFTQEGEFIIHPLFSTKKRIVKPVGYLFPMRNLYKIKSGKI